MNINQIMKLMKKKFIMKRFFELTKEDEVKYINFPV